jgi:hypothetical protein
MRPLVSPPDDTPPKVRKTPRWPRIWANLSLFQPCDHRNARARSRLLGQPCLTACSLEGARHRGVADGLRRDAEAALRRAPCHASRGAVGPSPLYMFCTKLLRKYTEQCSNDFTARPARRARRRARQSDPARYPTQRLGRPPAGAKGAASAQKLGQPQPFGAVIPRECTGQLARFG